MKKRILFFACVSVIFFICACGLVLNDRDSETQIADKKMELIIKGGRCGWSHFNECFWCISGVDLVIHLGEDTLDEWCGAKEG